MIADVDELGVLTLVDSLAIGGTERVAISIANQLSHDGGRSFLCTTRHEGPLVSSVAPSVEQLNLHRSRSIEWKALRRLTEFIYDNRIGILHAHSSSVLTANLASRFSPYPRILWHDHFGINEQKQRPVWLYRGLMRRVGGIVTVSQPLADWSRHKLRFPSERVWCLPNFVDLGGDHESNDLDLPGRKGSRIVCVANLRPVKDHINLIRGMKHVVDRHPQSHLLLVGGLMDDACVTDIRREIETHGLDGQVSILGPSQNVPDLLRACDIGVLSSRAEGLPVSLLEYGAAGLPVVVTGVGQCGSVLDDGRLGFVVSPGQPIEHANAVISLLDCEAKRESLGSQFRERVRERYSAKAVIPQLRSIYEKVLTP